MPSFSSSQLHVHLQRVTTDKSENEGSAKKKRHCRNELQSKLKKRFFENSLPRSTQTGLALAGISLRGLSEASVSSAEGVWSQLTQQPMKTEQRYTALSSSEECLCIPFCLLCVNTKMYPSEADAADSWRAQPDQSLLCTYSHGHSWGHKPGLRGSLPQPSPPLHLWHVRNTSLSHTAKPPVHSNVTHGQAIQKELLQLRGQRPQAATAVSHMQG